MGGYLTAIEREIDLRAKLMDAQFGSLGSANRQPLETLYLGGGTPSLLPTDRLAALIDRIRDRFGLTPNAEVTLEANPGADERGDLAGVVQAGVTRLSVGVQVMDTTALRALGRRHTPDDVVATIAAARAAGFASLSMDLLADLPDLPFDAWAASLDAAIALTPDHLSVYALTLSLGPDEAGDDRLATPAGAVAWRERAAAAQDEERGALELEHLNSRLPAAGYNWYEISNWATAGHESRHNTLYWERASVAAVGPGAHAFDGVTRRWNSANLDAWEGALQQGELPPGGESPAESGAAGAAEGLVLALRMARGVERDAAVRDGFSEAIIWGESNGLLAPHPTDASRIQLTLRGRLLSNELFSRIV
jgi:oxygen-independent coproporphyrinogen-3 oxidase